MQIVKRMAAALAAVSCLAGGTAVAASYDFNMAFDGSSLSYVPNSDVAAGTVLNVGDTFSISLSAAGNDYWQVNKSIRNSFIPLTFGTKEGGRRTGDISTVWSLDGAQQIRTDEMGVSQRYVHIGAQHWSLGAGLQFDTVTLDYTLTASDVSTTLTGGNSHTFLMENYSAFFGDRLAKKISYVSVPDLTAVPLPAALPMLLAAIGGLFVLRRRRSA